MQEQRDFSPTLEMTERKKTKWKGGELHRGLSPLSSENPQLAVTRHNPTFQKIPVSHLEQTIFS